MTRHRQLLRAMGALLPDAEFRIVDCSDWHSLTFSGERLTIVAELEGDETLARRFAAALPDQEFDFPGVIVADIAVTDFREFEKTTRLEIEALVLDE